MTRKALLKKALAEAEKKADEKAIKGAKADLEAALTFEKTINAFWDANKAAIDRKSVV
mgnify:CR=1 FL=1